MLPARLDLRLGLKVRDEAPRRAGQLRQRALRHVLARVLQRAEHDVPHGPPGRMPRSWPPQHHVTDITVKGEQGRTLLRKVITCPVGLWVRTSLQASTAFLPCCTSIATLRPAPPLARCMLSWLDAKRPIG